MPGGSNLNRAVHPRSRFLAPGDKLGTYSLIRQIAVGGMAELYLARTLGIEGFEKLVVVKRILPQFASNASFVTMFINEARLAATLHHPNIAQVYDIGQEGQDYFFSMEYVHGEDLGTLVSVATDSGVPISLDVSLTLVAGLCAGLHYAHDKLGSDGKPLQVVHRDVSPSNVLVSYDGAVKLVDFGIARAGNKVTTARGGLKGKIGYMSPEQGQGNIALDRRSDVFSAGSILYELTTGRLPFVDETEYGVLNQIVNTDALSPSRLVPNYPPQLEAIVLRALARDRDRRYPSALELQGHIEDFAHEHRLRISPLVLARLMGSLFPARLEEWEDARTQGAFFLEQHVVRTLIENGKGAEPVPAQLPEGTIPGTEDAGPAPVIARPARLAHAPSPMTPVPGRMWASAPGRMLTPVPGYPGEVPIMRPGARGTLVSSSSSPSIPAPTAAELAVGDVTERVRVPSAYTARMPLAPARSALPLILLALVGALGAVAVTVIMLRGGSADEPSTLAAPAREAETRTETETATATATATGSGTATESATGTATATATGTATGTETATVTETVTATGTVIGPGAATDPRSPRSTTGPATQPPPTIAAPVPAAPPVAAAVTAVDDAPPGPPIKAGKRSRVKRPNPKRTRTKPRAPKSGVAPAAEPTAEPEEPSTWNADSPFMPVRPATP
ncbi:MAG: serine/threonine protein kinase [Myxococcota bacterium]|nr:serine/threonine protein kinase [Myxococcota bacterium]